MNWWEIIAAILGCSMMLAFGIVLLRMGLEK